MAEEDDLIGSFFSEIQEIEACAGEPGVPPPSDAQFASVISRPVVFAKSAEVVAAAAPSIRVVPVEYPDSIESARLNRYSHSSEHAAPVGAAPPIKRQDKKFVRAGANEVWVDETLCEWPENDFRLFVGDLGNEVTTEMLAKEFQGKYSSFAKAKVVRTGWNLKSKGYGFVSFMDAFEAAKALREMNGKYIGNRPMRIKKSSWQDRDIAEVKKNDKKKKKMLQNLGLS